MDQEWERQCREIIDGARPEGDATGERFTNFLDVTSKRSYLTNRTLTREELRSNAEAGN